MKTTKVLITLCVFLATFLVGGIALADDSGIFDSVTSDSALEAPKLTITGTNVSLSWTTVAGAMGYNLYYAPYPYTGPGSIKNIPMKTQTSMSGSLSDGDAIYVGVRAYNNDGISGFSNIKCVSIGTCMPEGGGCSCNGFMNGTRWCDNQNGTVTDMATCLVWLKDASWGGEESSWAKIENWQNAQSRASWLMNGVGGLSDGSVEGDWRLPTKTELSNLANGTEPVRSGNMRAFTGVMPSNYWTSSYSRELMVSTTHVWEVNLSNGTASIQEKTKVHRVWPVRH